MVGMEVKLPGQVILEQVVDLAAVELAGAVGVMAVVLADIQEVAHQDLPTTVAVAVASGGGEHRGAWCGWHAAGLTLALAVANGSIGEVRSLTTTQLWVLAYLALGASALGFFLWNVGAAGVRAGTLAVFNNVKVPLAVLVSLAVFREPDKKVENYVKQKKLTMLYAVDSKGSSWKVFDTTKMPTNL